MYSEALKLDPYFPVYVTFLQLFMSVIVATLHIYCKTK